MTDLQQARFTFTVEIVATTRLLLTVAAVVLVGVLL